MTSIQSIDGYNLPLSFHYSPLNQQQYFTYPLYFANWIKYNIQVILYLQNNKDIPTIDAPPTGSPSFIHTLLNFPLLLSI